MVNYEKICKLIKQEIESETEIIEELAYKRGYKKGLEEGELDIAESYVAGLEDGVSSFKDIINMSPEDRIEVFGCSKLIDIFNSFEPVDIFKKLTTYKDSKKDNKCSYDELEELLKTFISIYGGNK